jgi:hypothetical protein
MAAFDGDVTWRIGESLNEAVLLWKGRCVLTPVSAKGCCRFDLSGIDRRPVLHQRSSRAVYPIAVADTANGFTISASARPH